MTQLVTTRCLFTALLALGVWMFRWQYRNADARLREWAERSHYRVLDKQRANPLGTGPSAARAGNKQIMYRVTVSDAGGERRSALIKIGSEAMGVLSDQLVVEWDELH